MTHPFQRVPGAETGASQRARASAGPAVPTGPAAPAGQAIAQANAEQAQRIDARTRSSASAERTAGAAREARAAEQAADSASSRVHERIPDPMTSLSTAAIAGALNSVPATLNMMQRVAVAAGSGGLSPNDMAQLQTDYAQLTQKISALVAQANASGDTPPRQDDGRRDDSGAAPAPPPAAPVAADAGTPAVPSVTTGHSTPAPRPSPQAPAGAPVQALHVGADSYEPVAARQPAARTATPVASPRLDQRRQSHRALVKEVRQITQLSQPAEAAPVPPHLSAVA